MRALVTGASRGLGREVSARLSAAGHEVIGTAREAGSGWRLDLADPGSVGTLMDRVRAEVGPIDLLVDNAGISLVGFDVRVARETLQVNTRGTIALTEALLSRGPVGRVVVVSSGMGELAGLSGSARADLELDLDVPGILGLADRFEDAVARGTVVAQGWPKSAYSVSKALINRYVRHLATRGVRAVAVCPGWVRTDMGGSGASRSVPEGAKGIVWACTDPDVRAGTFYRDGRVIPW